MPKSEVRPLSFRRPLRDVANNFPSATAKKIRDDTHRPKPRVSDPNDTQRLDRLRLLQSDLSSLVRQVDELVVQAFRVNSTSEQGKREVESFGHDLSEMLASLKPWVPRFQRVISGSCSERETCLVSESISAVNEVEPESPESPDEPNPDLLISPSPLVSWRANCTTAGGQQLFLLTPLPISKGLSSKHQDPPKSVFERVTSHASKKFLPFNSIAMDTKRNLLQAGLSDMVVATEASTPMMFSKSKHSIVVMTPCLKRSPPKSCVLLEEISELPRERYAGVRKSTPFPTSHKCVDSDASESSSGSEASKDIAFKYPELLGIQNTRKSVVTKKQIEESPDWFRSPPKTCVLLEPLNEKALGNNPKSVGPKETLVELVESTPLVKESQSTCRIGKFPGENTLKKELWTKFEAASSRELSFNISLQGQTSQKGFLDRLDEVSCDREI